MKINFFKKKYNFKKKKFDINPTFYWQIAVFSTALIMTASFVFGYYLFIKINQEPVLPVANDAPQVGTVNKIRIEKVLNDFSERAQTSNEILSSPSPVVDPSQ
jgi:hypothetical protein